MPLDWSPLWIGLRCAVWGTVIATSIALPAAWLFANRRFPGSGWIESIFSLPLVLPPAVTLYYLLAAYANLGIPFRWRIAAIFSAVYALPLLLDRFRDGLAGVNHAYENAARTLGAGEWRTLFRITVPLAWPALAAVVITGFLRSLADAVVAAWLAAGPARSPWILIATGAAAIAGLYGGARLRRTRVLA